MHSLNHILPQDQAKALDQPLDWPFPCRAFLSWSHSFPNYEDRKAGIEAGTRYWHRMLGQKHGII